MMKFKLKNKAMIIAASAMILLAPAVTGAANLGIPDVEAVYGGRIN